MKLTIDLPDDFYAELCDIASQLKQTPEQSAILALSHFAQTDTVDNAIEGMARTEDSEVLVGFPELQEELGLEIKFHPMAMEELEAIEEEDQIEILEQLIHRIASSEEELDGTLDLVLKEESSSQIVLSGFDFGDVIYKAGQNIIVYHLALHEDENEDDEEELDDEFENALEREAEHVHN